MFSNPTRSNWNIQIRGNVAWARFIETVKQADGSDLSLHDLRVLEKQQDNKWRIALLGGFTITEPPVPVSIEEEAIKKVIIDETKAFNEGNIEALMDAHGDVPYFQWAVTNGGEPGDALTYRSTKAFKDWAINLPWFKNYNPNNPPKPSATQMLKDNWNIQIKGNIAIVTLDEHWINEQAKTKLDVTISKILEKLNGKWKIINTAAVGDFKDATPPIRSKY